MLEIFIFCLLLFITLMFRVAEPIVVKTVSNKTESCEKRILAPESVINLSFLHEHKLTTKQVKIVIFSVFKRCFMFYKYKRIKTKNSINLLKILPLQVNIKASSLLGGDEA
jgi:hypothetical protein